MNFSLGNLKKVENLLKEMGYLLRYEKGNFNSGYCLLKDKKIIIINKYFTDDVKFQKLIDILQIFDIQDSEGLSESSLKILEKLFPIKVTENLIPFDDGK
ncbi:MAG: hypothetical protein ACK5UE_12665 [Chitinophagales bacterium]|jgi:hypothetical protein|nr:hypothetical protein [Sphingobacteriales bacterium]